MRAKPPWVTGLGVAAGILAFPLVIWTTLSSIVTDWGWGGGGFAATMERNRVGAAYRDVLLQDSLDAWAARRRGAVTVLARDDDPRTRRAAAALDSAYAAFLTRLGRPPRLPMVVSVSHRPVIAHKDTTGALNGYPPSTWQYVRPPREPGEACVVSLRTPLHDGDIPEDRRGHYATATEWLAARNPCLFYVAFGLPGRGWREWLADHQHHQAVEAAWWRPSPFRVERPARPGQPSVLFEGAAMASFIPMAVESRIRQRHLLACRANPPADCAEALFSLASGVLSGRRGSDRVVHGLDVVDRVPVPTTNAAGELGDDVISMLAGRTVATMVERLGPERFEAFWTSDLPLPDALAATTGRSADEVAAEWLGLPPLEHAPALGASGPAIDYWWVVLIVAACVGISVRSSVTRQAQ